MTPLRQRMLEELCASQLRTANPAELRGADRQVGRHFGVSPDQLTREQVQAVSGPLDQQARQLAAAGDGRHAVLL